VIPAMLENATQGELQRYENNYKVLNLITTALHRNAYVSYPVPRKRERSLHTCAQDVQITRMATIDKQMQCYK
jgi:hypothetical protein